LFKDISRFQEPLLFMDREKRYLYIRSMTNITIYDTINIG